MLNKLLLLLVILFVLAVIFFLAITDPFKKNSRAGLQIEYQNGSASVFLNDNYLGKAPLLEEKLQKGEYILKISPDDEGLSSLSLPVYLEPGTLTILVYNPGKTSKDSSSTIFELRKRNDKKSSVSFESYPENALISFDNRAMTFSPLKIEGIEAGEHHFSVSLPSYEAQDHSFLVLEGYETKITINLAKNIILEAEEPVDIVTKSVIQEKIEVASQSATASATSNANEASPSAAN